MVLHEELLDVAEAVCQAGLGGEVQDKQALPRGLHGVPVDGLDALHILVQNIFILPLLLLLVLLDEGDAPAVFGLEEFGVLVGVKELTFLRPVELLLQHPIVAVGNGLF